MWWFSVLDVIGVLNDQDDDEKNNTAWEALKAKLEKESNQLGCAPSQLPLTAPAGGKRRSDVLDQDGIVALAKLFPAEKANRFIDWFTYSDETLDAKSKHKAYALFESGVIDTFEVGTTQCLQQIHAFIFGNFYVFAGQIRADNISKGGFAFAQARFLTQTLETVEAMPETTLDEIVDKYIEMNIAHPFLEGNGRSTRIWLDQMLKKNLARCVDWSQINKMAYLQAMKRSTADGGDIKKLIESALTDKINDREMFMKGVDYSYYYEEDGSATAEHSTGEDLRDE